MCYIINHKFYSKLELYLTSIAVINRPTYPRKKIIFMCKINSIELVEHAKIFGVLIPDCSISVEMRDIYLFFNYLLFYFITLFYLFIL